MEQIVVAGIDTIPGANLAAWLSDRYRVLGISFGGPVAIAGCDTLACPPDQAESLRERIADEAPSWIVYCGTAARSTWDAAITRPGEFAAVQAARMWAEVATDCDSAFTVISSDAVFTGPWMFHAEESTSFCDIPAAQAIRAVEREVMAICRRTLVVRTNVYGWSPLRRQPGLVEQILNSMAAGTTAALDCIRHATPILATDLAELLEQAYQRKLQGVYHIAGAERVNPARFGALLAGHFGETFVPPVTVAPLRERRTDFGAGETSLQCRRIRAALETSLPLLADGLSRLYTQSHDGFRDRIGQSQPQPREMVA